MSMIGFPLLLIPLAIVNILAFLMPGVAFTDPIASVTLTSRAVWKLTFGDALLAFSLLLLLCEVIKGSRPTGKYFTDHFLAFLVLAAAIAEFLLLPQFGNSVQFLLIVLMLVDFIAGLSLRWRRRGTVTARSTASKPSHAVWEPAGAAPNVAAPTMPEPRPEKVAPPPLMTIDPAYPAVVSGDNASPLPERVSGETISGETTRDVAASGPQTGLPSAMPDHPLR